MVAPRSAARLLGWTAANGLHGRARELEHWRLGRHPHRRRGRRVNRHDALAHQHLDHHLLERAAAGCSTLSPVAVGSVPADREAAGGARTDDRNVFNDLVAEDHVAATQERLVRGHERFGVALFDVTYAAENAEALADDGLGDDVHAWTARARIHHDVCTG